MPAETMMPTEKGASANPAAPRRRSRMSARARAVSSGVSAAPRVSALLGILVYQAAQPA